MTLDIRHHYYDLMCCVGLVICFSTKKTLKIVCIMLHLFVTV